MANGASLRRNAAALFVLRSLSYSAPSTPKPHRLVRLGPPGPTKIILESGQ